MFKNKKPEPVRLTPKEVEALKSRLNQTNLSEADKKLFIGLMTFSLWLENQLNSAKMTIQRLKNFFGFKTEKKKKQSLEKEGSQTGETVAQDSKGEGTTGEGKEDASSSFSSKTTEAKKKPVWDETQNHGRYGAEDYRGCEQIAVPHGAFKPGSFCPNCLEGGTQAKVYRLKTPRNLIYLTGQPLIQGTIYALEKWRCGLCGEVYEAEKPKGLEGKPKYDERCISNIALSRYYLGMPFKRLEYFQKLQGVPVADATQWEQVCQGAKAIAPVFLYLETLAAQGRGFYVDDTPNRILMEMGKRASASIRKGIYTTALVSEWNSHKIYLFYTSGRYAAENLKPLLLKRKSDEPFFTMSDASRNNLPKGLSKDLVARWVICFCLVHGRRRFYEIADFFEPECEFVLELIQTLYENERDCNQQKLTPEKRLLYHQAHSRTLMKSLWVWLNNQLLHGQVERHSGLGKAIRYMLRHWRALTRFLEVPGVPMDNSICERAIKVVLRHKKNSYFYRTLFGADVGDKYMSLFHTAAASGVNLFHYLNTLQQYAKEVALSPERWLPWNYGQTLTLLEAPPEVA